MDTLTFMASFFESVSWPVAFVLIAVVLRKEIRRLLLRTKRIKHNDTELEFFEEVKAVSEKASELLPESSKTTIFNEKGIKLAQFSPRGAILESWLGIEEALNSYASRHGIQINEKTPFTVQSLELHQLDYQQIGKGVINILRRLEKIRNDAAHLRDCEIEPESAIEFIHLANQIIQRIEEA